MTRLQQLNATRIDTALHVFALLALLLLAAQSLDRRELDSAEAVHAVVLLAPLDGGPVPLFAAQPAHAVLRAFSFIAGATERSLRIPCVFALLLAAILCASIAHKLFGPRGRAAALLCYGISGFIVHSARLDAETLGVVPVALLAGLLLPAPRHAGWNCAALVGALLTPLFAAQLHIVVLVLAVFCALGVGSARRAPALGVALLLALHVPWALGAVPLWAQLAAAPEGTAGLTHLLAGSDTAPYFGATCLALACSTFALSELWSNPRALLPVCLGLLLLACTATASGGLQWSGGRFAALLPLASLLFAFSLSAATPRAARWALLLTLLLCLWMASGLTGGGTTLAAKRAADPLRSVLQAARMEGASGGRLILAGPDRFALLYYSRRGHDPGMPVLLCPEDVTAAELAPRMKYALGMLPGSAKAPPVLLWPADAVKTPGLHQTTLPGVGLVLLQAERD